MTDEDDEIKFHTTEAVAEMFSIEVDTVRKWIREGKITAVKINGYWRIPHHSLKAYAQSLLDGPRR